MSLMPRPSSGRLSDQIYELLRARIVSGAMPPDSQISESEIAQEMQISRTPLRDALQHLMKDGLVVIYPQFGSFVAPISLDAAEQAQFVREHLECGLIPDVVAKIDDAGRDRLLGSIEQQRAALKAGDSALFYELDERLHAELAAISGRIGVGELIRQQKIHLDRVRHLSLPMEHQIPKLIEQHAAFVTAIVEGDAAAAETALRLHLREIFTVIENLGLRSQAEARLPKRRQTKR